MPEITPPEPGETTILPLWVSGLRPKVTGKDWRKAVAFIVLNEVEQLPSSDSTVAAELGLGIKPCLYWYILRAEELFGYAVFTWRASISKWSPDEGGVSPFDSGGLWHGHIHTSPALKDSEAKKALFDRYSLSLTDWDMGFRSYLSDNYDKLGDYIQGLPPRRGVPGIIKGSPNFAQSWTWEARVRRDAPRLDRVRLQKLYWHQAQADNFLNWVEQESLYDDPVQEQLTEWVLTHMILCPVSESPTQKATLDLIEISGG